MKPTGWPNESERHALSSHGIKSRFTEAMKSHVQSFTKIKEDWHPYNMSPKIRAIAEDEGLQLYFSPTGVFDYTPSEALKRLEIYDGKVKHSNGIGYVEFGSKIKRIRKSDGSSMMYVTSLPNEESRVAELHIIRDKVKESSGENVEDFITRTSNYLMDKGYDVLIDIEENGEHDYIELEARK